MMDHCLKPLGGAQINIANPCVTHVCLTQVGIVEIGLAEVGIAEVGSVEVSPAKVSTVEVGMAEVGVAKSDTVEFGTVEFSLTEVRMAEICPVEASPTETDTSEVGPAEVGPKEINPAELGIAEVWSHVCILFSPLIPNLHPLLENGEMLLISHVPLHCLLKPPHHQANKQVGNESHHRQVSHDKPLSARQAEGSSRLYLGGDMAKRDAVSKSHVA
jgi:hypothetical protein